MAEAATDGCTVGNQNPQRPYAEHEVINFVKIWSDPHGDMGTQAERETTWARSEDRMCRSEPEVTDVSVPIHCGRRRLEKGCP